MTGLPTPRRQLMRHELDDQILLYDPSDDKVHLLDLTTGKVFQWLEEGSLSREEIVLRLWSEESSSSGEAMLNLALDELAKAGLLESSNLKSRLSDVSRREMLRRAALTGVAATLIPAIATLTARPAYAQGSCIADCNPCTADRQCCGGKCDAVGGTVCGKAHDCT